MARSYAPAAGAKTDAVRDDALFAALDVETTGLFPLVGDRIIELAIVRFGSNGVAADEFPTLVDPQCDVDNSHVHGLLASDLAGAPTFHEIVGDVLSVARPS
jgi:DNA polymerase III epsilon subunit-like protein